MGGPADLLPYKVLDEHHFVSLGAVHQLIRTALGHEQTHPARPDASLSPQFEMPERLVSSRLVLEANWDTGLKK